MHGEPQNCGNVASSPPSASRSPSGRFSAGLKWRRWREAIHPTALSEVCASAAGPSPLVPPQPRLCGLDRSAVGINDLGLVVHTGIEPNSPRHLEPCPTAGGRTWWAHLEFARVNIQLTILPQKVEELMNVKGIGEKSFLKLKPMVTVGAEKADRQGDK